MTTTTTGLDLPRFQLHWRSLLTAAAGQGTGYFTEAEARQITADLNAQDHGLLHHWYAFAPDDADYLRLREIVGALTVGDWETDG